MDNRNPKKPQKKYSEPKLTSYGTVRDLTKMVGFQGQNDGGTGRNKTSA